MDGVRLLYGMIGPGDRSRHGAAFKDSLMEASEFFTGPTTRSTVHDTLLPFAILPNYD